MGYRPSPSLTSGNGIFCQLFTERRDISSRNSACRPDRTHHPSHNSCTTVRPSDFFFFLPPFSEASDVRTNRSQINTLASIYIFIKKKKMNKIHSLLYVHYIQRNYICRYSSYHPFIYVQHGAYISTQKLSKTIYAKEEN